MAIFRNLQSYSLTATNKLLPTMNLIRSSLKVLIAKVISSLTSFLAVVIFSRELGASPLGTYYPFLAILGILAIPSDFGIRSATEKRLSEGEDAGSYLGTAITLKFPPLILTTTVILFSANYIEQYLGTDLALPLVLTLFVHEGARLSISVLRGELRVGETAVVQILRPLGWLIVGYAFYSRGYGVHGLVYGYFVGTTAMLVVGWWKVSTPISWPTLQHARSLFDYGRFSVISAVGGYFYSWMDVLILTLFVTLGIASTRGEIGAYENAWRISLVVLMVSQAIATTIFPQVSRWDAEGATEQIESIIPTALFPALLVVMPAFVGTVVLAKDILRVLFTPEFTVAWLALIILMGEKVLQAVHVVLGRSLQAIDRPDLAAYATIVAVAINLVLNVILIWQFGIAGAALATTISFIANTVLHAHYLRQFLDIEFPTRDAAWSVGASIVMGVAVYWVRTIIVVDTMLQLLAIIGFGMVIYIALVLSYSPIRMRVRTIIGPALPEWIALPR